MKIKFKIIYVFLSVLFFSCGSKVEEKSVPVVQDLKVEEPEVAMQFNPMGISPEEVRFGWQLQSSGFNVKQLAYRIQLSENKDFDGNLYWDSGKVNSEKSQHIKYAGPKLKNAQDYYWKIQVWTGNNTTSESETSHFFTAPGEDALKAEWIGAISRADSYLPEGRKMHTPTFKKSKRDSIVDAVDSLAYRSIMLRKEFQSGKDIKSAKVYVSGLGHYKLSINGKNIGNSEFAPLWTDYDKTVYYNIYDVTTNLQQGENAVGVMLGNGMYNVIGDRYSKFFVSFGPPTLFLQLRLTYEDGSEEIIKTDDSWKYTKSPITFNTLFGGEDYDARMEQPGWNTPDFDAASWKPVVLQQAPKGKLIPQTAPPVSLTKSYKVKEVNSFNDTTYILDMGQNLSGFPKIKARGKRGDKIKIWVGEKLQDDGTIAQGGSGKPYYYEYTFKGDGIEEWRPYFSYYGYQYIQIEGANYKKDEMEGLPTVLEVNSLFVNNSAKPGGTFTSSNEIFNKAHELIDAAIKSNFHSVFTDCPHREKLGWLEETHLNGPGLFYNYHLEGFIPKIMRDIADAQRENGLIPNIAPEYIIFGGDFTDSPEWGLAGIMLPWMYYEYYGDASLIEQYYPVMTKYVDYLSSTAENHIVDHGLGDWYDYGEHAAGYSKNSPIALSATSHYFYGASLVAKAADMLGRNQDAKKYQNLSTEIRKAFNNRFYNPKKGNYATGSQFSNAVPIYMGIVEPENKEKVMNSLLDTIKANNYRLTTGDVGNRYLFQTLAENDQNEVMYKMQNHYDTPGYGFQIKFGLTTLTEQWDPRNGNSLNHFMMGQIEEWFYKSLAGIVPDEENPGYKHFFLQPELVGDMEFVKASYESLYGKIISEWERDSEGLSFKFTIPANTSATVKLPVNEFSEVTLNAEKLETYENISGKTVFEVGSGSYSINVRL
ncbi:glycoside hydrolase family 78 protein [Autumnicola musiva]|uniref:alpha-L-rhamnosidase n=1 Tax=Autumnicola musiva TaxID=3075589 RepID=A0ABU3D7Q5_9FLAO|nr:glycoside hydrolase family 78 protein [Zunongwangia sp. F117]MDT0677565.1 glycoside hydrolase family 78 protein [Zunongwangia sp. F117]